MFDLDFDFVSPERNVLAQIAYLNFYLQKYVYYKYIAYTEISFRAEMGHLYIYIHFILSMIHLSHLKNGEKYVLNALYLSPLQSNLFGTDYCTLDN